MQIPLLFGVIFILPAILIAFVVHEMCHGYAAYLFGDPTAKYEGRLNPNPLMHLDPIGAAVLLLTALTSNFSFVFGWAKPVSVNPHNFRSPRQDMAWVAFAGPLSNFTMAALAGLLLKFHLVTNVYAATFIFVFVMVNTGLGIFNLIPFPPLDGSKILYGILPSDWAYKLMNLEMRYAPFIPFFLAILVMSRILDPIIYIPYTILVRVFTS